MTALDIDGLPLIMEAGSRLTDNARDILVRVFISLLPAPNVKTLGIRSQPHTALVT